MQPCSRERERRRKGGDLLFVHQRARELDFISFCLFSETAISLFIFLSFEPAAIYASDSEFRWRGVSIFGQASAGRFFSLYIPLQEIREGVNEVLLSEGIF